ncbi:xanthine dehydrogenase family protein molybdopterin-binding subunit (plasmid) [Skermanella sp. TT6]|uniref:Xanthine dehydrogenase family protein molybdopterin-binding subunit n=1 Tax=Skermanella cutis TaxID=2775420 RepID=A0ABX7BIE1_9PROT|nr:xanthine dehydrogenase family protein molybdopterin-binding subunit [Skermanella sp. TT6]QQP92866.1 xanthine dehydrogenase family protein molybdopterin-binding subunit [Skermanella sp. TT6]
MTPNRTADRPRFDAREKVLGRALYAADQAFPGLLHAMTVPATIAKGRILSIDTAAARAVQGVVRIFTHDDFSRIRTTPATRGAYGQPGKGYQPMTVPQVRHRGEPVALVVAETLEAAIEGAEAVTVRYAEEPFSALMEDGLAGPEAEVARQHRSGDAEAAFAGAAHVVDVEYLHPQQHHNPIELISTTAAFEGGTLRIYEGTQAAAAFAGGLAGMMGMEPQALRGVSPYTGGGFGQKNGVQEQSVLVASAALLLRRPVKLVMPRGQLFHTASYRPRSRHRVRLAADGSGRLLAGIYETVQQNSRYDGFASDHGANPPRMYDYGAWRGSERIIRVDSQTPGHQRAPYEHPASYATECAIDELAGALGMDPVSLRLANDARRDPITGKPFSSRHLAECLRRGAALFGWDRRRSVPGTLAAGNGDLIGLGVACGSYKAAMTPSVTTLRLSASGRCEIATSGHEMGQGLRSVIAEELIDVLGADPGRIEIRIGDTGHAPQHLTAGSWGAGSAAPAARAAALRLREELVLLTGAALSEEPVHVQLARTRRPFLEVTVDTVPLGKDRQAIEQLRRGVLATTGPEYPDFLAFSWIAHFAEVHVEPSTGRVRVERVVSVADCGRVMNRRTAESQVRSGVVWGIGAALREVGEIDPRFGGALNNDLAEYVVPVNADIGAIDVDFIDEPDIQLNISGVKGLGEVAMVGAAAAIVNAVHNATGKRIRHLPIRVEDLL